MKPVEEWSRKQRGILVIIVLCLLVFINISLQGITSEFDAANYLPKIFQCFSNGGQNESNAGGKKVKRLAVDPRVWLRYKGKTWRELQLPVIASYADGRLGNLMGIYATIYGIGKAYNVTVRQIPRSKAQMSGIFPNMTIPLIPGEYNSSEWLMLKHYATGSYGGIEAAAAGLLGPHLFIASGASFEIQLFNAHRNDILNEFTFSRDIQQKVEDFWKAQKTLSAGLVFIGFHIRRTDYVSYIKTKRAHLPGPKYFRNAMDYYRTRFSSVLFVVSSDDMGFARSALANYSDIIFAPGKKREEDMAILASCNHSIITLGSFGFWTGYLTGGLVVFPNITASSNYPFQRERYEMSGLDFFVMVPSD